MDNEFVLERYLLSLDTFALELTENEMHILANIIANASSPSVKLWQSPLSDSQENILAELYGKVVEGLTA